MVKILLSFAKYFLVFIMLIYSVLCFFINASKSEMKAKGRLLAQKIIIFMFFSICIAISVYYDNAPLNIIVFGLEFVYLILMLNLYKLIYPGSSAHLTNNMCMMLMIGFVMVKRLSPNHALKQFVIVLIGSVLMYFVPLIIKKRTFLYKCRYAFCVFGLAALSATIVLGKLTWGAKISVDIMGFSFQPSEFIKLVFVVAMAAFLSRAAMFFKNIVISAIFAALHVFILIASTDLGTALIFFMVYIFMLYIATGKIRYVLAGFGCMAAGSVLSYRLFSHVRNRVAAFINPWSIIDTGGYQVTQSLFAIGTGGMFGLGLYQGMPQKIPVVVKDFVFAAYSEEFGMISAICLILITLSTFIEIMKNASKCRDLFYKLTACGFAILYIFQCFITIGGVTKFIPSTGVTLPFVSYGGSSILCSLIMFAIIQSVFILVKEFEGDEK